ncbi:MULTISPECIES: hypothetical protein [unclassified Halomonas]|uniref:hypothetical protein n=1 Tax=unclassified Halomonas TaxID=2609666 RepID=UPI001BE63B6C|nr:MULTISPECIES: hypothetical protein [unclassified Halomonas]MBT2786722.1 hypothetical protein [Halomonas sp. ISL-106]MBT2798626.1 hypothetical protein [Halomonas sp. ISL-104]
MTIDELIPSIVPLSHGEKIRLVQVVLQQLAQEEATSAEPTIPANDDFEPQRFFGLAHQSRQEVDGYLASLRDGWD